MSTVLEVIIYIAIALIVGVITLQFMNFKEWLSFACSVAEEALGGGTGKLKLRYVYDMAVEKFGFIVKILPFNVFSKMVDKALETMKTWIATNEKISGVIEGANEITEKMDIVNK